MLASSLHLRADHGAEEEDLPHQELPLQQADDQVAEGERSAHVEEGVEEHAEADREEVSQRKPNVARALACSAVGSPVSSRTT